MAMEAWLLAIVSTSSVAVFLMFLGLILIYLTTGPYPDIDYRGSERYYIDPNAYNEARPLPSLQEHASLDLSVIVPAYNEENRLPSMLTEALQYLEKRAVCSDFKYEIIIADDGSQDKTTETGWTYSKRYGTEKVRVLTLLRNRGKGAAVRMGMLASRGRFLLFADADGATRFSDVDKLECTMHQLMQKHLLHMPTGRDKASQGEDLISFIIKYDNSLAVVCGSRAHLHHQSSMVQKQRGSLLRSLIMLSFHLFVRLLCGESVKDSQCGFKLFSRTAAKLLFFNMHVERWAFDVDLLYLARYFRVPVAEVPVFWHEIEGDNASLCLCSTCGSKIIPFFSWLQMAKDILLIRLRYTLGAWKIEPLHKLM